MLKRKSILLGVFVIVFTLGVAYVFAGMKKAPKERTLVSKEIIVPVQIIKNSKIDLDLSLVGNLEARDKVEVYAEVTGILKASTKRFLEGMRFSEGENLISIQDGKYRAEVYSNRSSFMTEIASVLPDLKFDYPDSYADWKTYLNQFNIEEDLLPIPKPSDEKEKYFLAGKNIYTSYYTIKSIEQQLEKYTITAPFTGEIIESNIKTGTLVMTGQKLGEFVNTSAYDLVVGVDLNNLSGINVGNTVKVYSKNTNGNWLGSVRRISKKVDPETQMVNVYIAVSGKNLKEGMFLNADVQLKRDVFGIEIPRKLLVNSEYVFTVDKGIINQQKISIIQKKEDAVVIEGLDDGVKLVLKTSGIHKGISVSTQEQ